VRLCHSFLYLFPRPPTPTLFPYTTLFRSPHGFSTRVTLMASLPPGVRLRVPGASAGPGRPRARSVRPGHVRSRRPCRASSLAPRSEEHTSELQSRFDLVCRLLLEKKKKKK